MKFWIDDENGNNYESFETTGHTSSNLSAHLDAMKIADAYGYSQHEGFTLYTEDGFLYEIVNPYADSDMQNLIAFDCGALIERAA